MTDKNKILIDTINKRLFDHDVLELNEFGLIKPRAEFFDEGLIKKLYFDDLFSMGENNLFFSVIFYKDNLF